MTHRALPLLIAVSLAASGAGAARAAGAAPADSVSARLRIDRADTSWVIDEPVVVVGTTASSLADPATATLDAIALAARDVHAASDLAPALPATRLVVNSRGESVFMVRGASERHVRLWFDGIPLNIPWDERLDASMVPVDAVGSVRGVRGVGSVLEGPNALAGTIELQPASLPVAGSRTRFGAEFGESNLREGRVMHQRRDGAWDLLAAGSWRAQDGFVVPADLTAPSNQGTGRQRLNSDFEQGSLLLRLQHHSASGATWHLNLIGSAGEKGVPPETHLAGDARFWRYPDVRRALVGLGVRAPLGSSGRWDLAVDAAADLFHQEIRAFDDATYATPDLTPGAEYETDDDRTGFARARLTRSLPRGSVSLQTSGRYANHRESLEFAGPELTYAQFVGEVAAEAQTDIAEHWRLRAGAGWDLATTPESGDKPSRDATEAPALFGRLERAFGVPLTLHASYARRSRFPALRELYSGALGRFVPNPDLAPEVQDLWDLGATWRSRAAEAGLTGFASYLDGAIERVELDDGTRRFRRVNLDAVRTLGLETVAVWRPGAAWEIGGHHTVLASRKRVEGDYSGPVEDRPAYVTFLCVAWRSAQGWRVTAEGGVLGPRMSADVNDEDDGLRRLPAQGTLNVRIARVLDALGPFDRAEVHLRLDNVLDREVETQTGLPLAGRTLIAGFSAGIDAWSGGH